MSCGTLVLSTTHQCSKCEARYYYAIATCDTVQAASHIFSELEGTELERSANVFDLSFVPDGMTFDEDPRYGEVLPGSMSHHSFTSRDEADDTSIGNYKGLDFSTDVRWFCIALFTPLISFFLRPFATRK